MEAYESLVGMEWVERVIKRKCLFFNLTHLTATEYSVFFLEEITAMIYNFTGRL